MELSAQQIADFLGGTVDGNPEVKVSNFSKIEEGQPGTLTFLANPKYEHYIYNTEASIVLVNNDFSPAEQITATLVKVENAYSALAMLLNLVEQSKPKKAGISSAAFIAASATMGEDCFVGNFAYNKNKIENLGGVNRMSDGDFMRQVGSPINSWFVYRTDGFFQSDEEAQAWMDKYAGQNGYPS